MVSLSVFENTEGHVGSDLIASCKVALQISKYNRSNLRW